MRVNTLRYKARVCETSRLSDLNQLITIELWNYGLSENGII